MNPIPLNERGQFRYADFMAYIPDFLREEPDVVELLQVMSDYINDAYRNIEDVEEFEFKICAVESRVSVAMRKLSRLKDMFLLASGRGDRVCYLSVPRANVKTNEVFGKATGNTPYTITLGDNYNKVLDRIPNANMIDAGGRLDGLDDGDVVYVTYTGISPNVTRAYYKSTEPGKNAELVADPEGSSQDPFTDSYNTAARIISFNVEDISGNIGKRYGGMNGYNTYYEVFFTARVTDVKSEPAVMQVEFDADKIDGVSDTLVVDYYGMNYVSSDKYHTTLSFYGGDGWKWKSGYPTGIFYLRDSSGAKLSAANGALGTDKFMMADPGLAMEATKYALTEPPAKDPLTGLYKFSTSVPLPQGDGARYYLVKLNSGTVTRVGEFAEQGQSRIEGELVSYMTPVWNKFDGTVETGDKYFLMTFPLSVNQGIPNYDKSSPIVRWAKEAAISDVPVDYSTAKFFRCKADNRTLLGTIGISERTGVGVHSFAVDRNIYGNLLSFISAHDNRTNVELYTGGKLWSGLSRMESYQRTVSGGTITMNPACYPSAAEDVSVYAGFDGGLTVVDGACTWGNLDTYREISELVGDDISNVPGILVCYDDNGDVFYRMVVSFDPGTGKVGFDRKLADGTYSCTFLYKEPEAGTVRGLADWSSDGTSFTGTCSSYTGDVYRPGKFIAVDRAGNAEVVNLLGDESGREIKDFAIRTNYSKGDIVYFDGLLYECTGSCYPEEGDTPANMGYFRVDRITQMAIPYKSMSNLFMPYYGPVKAQAYGEKVDYSGDMQIVALPLYITKIADMRLKYGWEHREFLNYGTNMRMGDRPRNGAVDIYSSATSDESAMETVHDAVTATLTDTLCKWMIDYPVIRYGVNGYGSELSIDIDDPVYLPVERVDDEWVVTVTSAGHGLSEGVEVRVSGIANPEEFDGKLDLNGYRTVHVIDGDTFSFSVPVEKSMGALPAILYAPVDAESSIKYSGDYRVDIDSIDRQSSSGTYDVNIANDPVGVKNGTMLEILYTVNGTRWDAEVTGDPIIGDQVIPVRVTGGTGESASAFDELVNSGATGFRLVRRIAAGDYVRVGDDVYEVTSGIWTYHDDQDIAIGATLFAKNNYLEIDDTNHEFAMGEDMEVKSLVTEDGKTAIVQLRKMFPHFTSENAPIINGRTMVYIHNAYPQEFNGWHTITRVFNPKTFEIAVRFPEGTGKVEGIGNNSKPILLNEGRWYKYSIDGIDWEKVSNRATFSLSNFIKSVEGNRVVTTREHGFVAGDKVLIASPESFMSVEGPDPDVSNISMYTVRAATGKFSFTVEEGVVPSLDGVVVTKGVLLTDPMDDLGSLADEYMIELESLGGKAYRFTDGSIVVAAAQHNAVEVKCWRVTAGAPWYPIRKKRNMKISALGVDEYPNGEYIEGAVEDGIPEYIFRTYSDVDVYDYDGAYYVAGFRNSRNAVFAAPALSGMDTTRNANAEYSSAEDYANVAPRHDMKASFKGIPSLKYPLVEKIERLCYMRDAYVIDFELIEYLARFMGYDITALGNDVSESSLYTTRKDRELAIRETIANLPQYYALGGTKAGLHMLMCAFGVISDAITLWTDANRPYETMISRAEVISRMENGDKGKWVPTPYIDLVVTDDAKYPQFAIRQSDIERIKEQIRVFKPINVVFRNIIVNLVDTVTVKPSIVVTNMSGSFSSGVVHLEDESVDEVAIEYAPDELTNCVF